MGNRQQSVTAGSDLIEQDQKKHRRLYKCLKWSNTVMIGSHPLHLFTNNPKIIPADLDFAIGSEHRVAFNEEANRIHKCLADAGTNSSECCQ